MQTSKSYHPSYLPIREVNRGSIISVRGSIVSVCAHLLPIDHGVPMSSSTKTSAFLLFRRLSHAMLAVGTQARGTSEGGAAGRLGSKEGAGLQKHE